MPRNDLIKRGDHVWVETKPNQGTGNLIEGIVKDILTHNRSHPYGIKVRLQDGQIGRVKRTGTSEELDSNTNDFTDLDKKEIPETEDKTNEFKEFYQYDKGIEMAAARSSKKNQAVEEIKRRTRTQVARAICSFGNDRVGGFVYLGINADGTVAGLEKDRKLGGFTDYEDSFANHVRDKLGELLDDKVFIASKLQIRFRRVAAKTICIIQVLPSSQPLYLNTPAGKEFFVRGPTPRAERLEGKDLYRYIKDRFPNYE